jgi:hypothetical protein
MPRNVYFSQAVRSEQHLYEDLIIESLKIYGQDVYYVPRTLVNRDNILNEDPASKFDDAYLIEMYIENTDGFEGAGDLYSKFGLEIRDECTFIVSRRQWEKIIGIYSDADNPRPQEGDVIFLPMTNSFFEISYVEDDKPFYQLSDIPVYRMQCNLFEYNDEDFDTGVGEIDDKSAQSAYQLSMNVNLSNSGEHFEVGETVSQILVPADGDTPAVVVFGEVITRTKSTDLITQINLANIGVTGSTTYRTFVVDNTKVLTGGTTGYTATIATLYDSIADNTSGRMLETDDAAQNMDFEIDADGFIDFSESNPFGDPSETY